MRPLTGSKLWSLSLRGTSQILLSLAKPMHCNVNVVIFLKFAGVLLVVLDKNDLDETFRLVLHEQSFPSNDLNIFPK